MKVIVFDLKFNELDFSPKELHGVIETPLINREIYNKDGDKA